MTTVEEKSVNRGFMTQTDMQSYPFVSFETNYEESV